MQKRKRVSGAILAIVILTALIASLAAYGILIFAMGHARRSAAIQARMQARYVAEAGLVIAMEHLHNEATTSPYPPSCTGVNVGTKQSKAEFVDTTGPSGVPDGTAAAPDPQVQVTITNCGAGRNHTIRVIY
jgi:Tfp pilus assembly protein PilX